MDGWRKRAIETFPERREQLLDEKEVFSLDALWWEVVLPLLVDAHRDEDQILLGRVYGYAAWSFDQADQEVVNAVGKCLARRVLDGSIRPVDATFLAADLYSGTDQEPSNPLVGLWDLHEPMLYLDGFGGTWNGSTYEEVAAWVVAEAKRLLADE